MRSDLTKCGKAVDPGSGLGAKLEVAIERSRIAVVTASLVLRSRSSTPGSAPIRDGEAVRLRLRPSRMHFFGSDGLLPAETD